MREESAYFLVLFKDYSRQPTRYANSKSFKREERGWRGNSLERIAGCAASVQIIACLTTFYVFLACPPLFFSIPAANQVSLTATAFGGPRLQTKLPKFRHIGRKLRNTEGEIFAILLTTQSRSATPPVRMSGLPQASFLWSRFWTENTLESG